MRNISLKETHEILMDVTQSRKALEKEINADIKDALSLTDKKEIIQHFKYLLWKFGSIEAICNEQAKEFRGVSKLCAEAQEYFSTKLIRLESGGSPDADGDGNK